jgi:hypothetical protein
MLVVKARPLWDIVKVFESRYETDGSRTDMFVMRPVARRSGSGQWLVLSLTRLFEVGSE